MNAPINRQEWLAARRTGIGGSDIAAVLGISPWTTPYDLWLDKRGEGEEVDPDSPPLYWGNVLEDVVAKEYAKRSGRKVQRVNQPLVHPEAAFARCNLDRAVVNPDIAGRVFMREGCLTTDRILECKTANAFAADHWGDAGTDQVPDYYLTQCVWNAAIAGAEVCDLPVLIGGSDFRIFTVGANPSLMDDMLEEAGRFWGMVQNGTPPEPTTLADAQKRWSHHIAEQVEIASMADERAISELHDIAEQMKELEARKKARQLDVAKTMQDAERLTGSDGSLCSWKTQVRETIDAKALRADHPDIAALYTKTSESRVFRLSKRKDS